MIPHGSRAVDERALEVLRQRNPEAYHRQVERRLRLIQTQQKAVHLREYHVRQKLIQRFGQDVFDEQFPGGLANSTVVEPEQDDTVMPAWTKDELGEKPRHAEIKKVEPVPEIEPESDSQSDNEVSLFLSGVVFTIELPRKMVRPVYRYLFHYLEGRVNCKVCQVWCATLQCNR